LISLFFQRVEKPEHETRNSKIVEQEKSNILEQNIKDQMAIFRSELISEISQLFKNQTQELVKLNTVSTTNIFREMLKNVTQEVFKNNTSELKNMLQDIQKNIVTSNEKLAKVFYDFNNVTEMTGNATLSKLVQDLKNLTEEFPKMKSEMVGRIGEIIRQIKEKL
jgi:hypothetical protein